MSNSYTAVVNQAINLLDGMSLYEYQKQLPPHFPSSIGVHIRHIIDHFLAVKNGYLNGHINYNKRHRYSEVELFPAAAIESLEHIAVWLRGVENNMLEKPVKVTTEVDVNCTFSCTSTSTFKRELVFASSHAIHHYALIRIMCSMQNKPTTTFFGYAPATITHINKSA